MIRKALEKDYAKLAQLWLETSLKAHDFVAADYWQNMQKSVLRDYLPTTETYVFEDKRQIKGFISVLENNFIGALFVAGKYQKKGIGRKLLTYVRRRRPALNLKVFSKNTRALRFYQNHDFKILIEQKDPSTGETELQMSWAVGCISGFKKKFQGDS